jgi:mono/diheme cytochrome c family protein
LKNEGVSTRDRLPIVPILVVVLTVSAAQVAAAADLEAGRQTFENTCAVCHGASGSPAPDSPVVQGLGVVPADLSDPLFNSREPAMDWKMVVRHGGEALGLAPQMPAHDALSDEEIDNVVGYIKSLADTSDYPPGEMNLFLPIRTKKAFPEDEVVYQGRFTPQDGDDAYRNVLEIEKRVGRSGQVFLELVHGAEADVSELAEVEVGYKRALSFSQRHILSGAALVAIPVEAEGDGELQTYLAYGRELSGNFTFQGSARFKLPFEDFGDGDVEFAGIVHYVHTPWPRRVFPGLELTATVPFDSDNGDLEWATMPQLRIGLTRGGHVALNLGVEVPLSGQDWDYQAYATLLWDFADGGFFQGW